jgi:hypothetical protein
MQGSVVASVVRPIGLMELTELTETGQTLDRNCLRPARFSVLPHIELLCLSIPHSGSGVSFEQHYLRPSPSSISRRYIDFGFDILHKYRRTFNCIS